MVYNEPYAAAAAAGRARRGRRAARDVPVLPVADATGPRAQLLASGVAVNWALRAQELLAAEWGVAADVWSVTSWNELRRDGLDADRHNLLYPGEPARTAYVSDRLAAAPGPVVAVSDYMRQVQDQIRSWVPGDYSSLGTDGWGMSDTRGALRRHFLVDAESIVRADAHRARAARRGTGRVGREGHRDVPAPRPGCGGCGVDGGLGVTARVALVTGGNRGWAGTSRPGSSARPPGRADRPRPGRHDRGRRRDRRGAMPPTSRTRPRCRLTRALAAAGTEPDLLVNNAGVDLEESPLQIREDLLSLQMATNLYGPWLLMRALVPGMVERATAASSTSAASALPSGPAGRAAARTASARQRSTP